MEDKNMENNTTETSESVEPVENTETKKKFNIFSLIGLIFSVVGAVFGITCTVGFDNGLFIFLPCAILGVIFGIVGLVFNKKYRTKSGLAMGIVAIIVGVLSLMAFAGFFIIVIIILTSIGKG